MTPILKFLCAFPSVLSWALALATACHGRDATTPGRNATTESYVLRVDTVQVSPTRPGGSPWDESPESDNGACGLLSALASAAYTPVAGAAASFLCRASSGQQSDREQNPTLPDLTIEIVAGNVEAYRSDVIANTIHHRFGTSFLVPIAAIPSDGLQLSVLDDDGGGQSELIGRVRLSTTQLNSTAESPTHLLLLADQVAGLEQLEIVVTRYQPDLQPKFVSFDAREGTRVAAPDVLAGEHITLKASGRYTIGQFNSDRIDPKGYPSGGPQGYNFQYEPFQSAPHGCGLALVGNRTRQGFVVAPCVQFVTPMAGPLIVGINDVEPANNSGQLIFEVRRSAPTVDEWQRHAISATCAP